VRTFAKCLAAAAVVWLVYVAVILFGLPAVYQLFGGTP
jgi:hypothetical protein